MEELVRKGVVEGGAREADTLVQPSRSSLFDLQTTVSNFEWTPNLPRVLSPSGALALIIM